MPPPEKKKFSHHFYGIKKNVLERGAINIVPGGEKFLNTALGGAKVCFCTTRKSLKYIIYKEVQNSYFRACIRHYHLNYYPIYIL